MVVRHPRPVSCPFHPLSHRPHVAFRYMMGSSLVLAASRHSFAFARDGALPLSKLLYRVNTYTGTPINTVWFGCVFALLLGLLALLGPAAISAVFSISVTATYVEYTTPMLSRFMFENDLKPGPFSLGVLVSPVWFVYDDDGGKGTLTSSIFDASDRYRVGYDDGNYDLRVCRVPRSQSSRSLLWSLCSSFFVSHPRPVQTWRR